jgi:hypothetical protein
MSRARGANSGGDHWLKLNQMKMLNNVDKYIHNLSWGYLYGHGDNAFDSGRMVFVDFFNAKGLTKPPTRA